MSKFNSLDLISTSYDQLFGVGVVPKHGLSLTLSGWSHAELAGLKMVPSGQLRGMASPLEHSMYRAQSDASG